MKTNSKRKVFGDAVDLLMGDMEEVTMPRGVQMVPVKSIHPFHDLPFHLYEGERLEDMIASVIFTGANATRTLLGPICQVSRLSWHILKCFTISQSTRIGTRHSPG